MLEGTVPDLILGKHVLPVITGDRNHMLFLRAFTISFACLRRPASPSLSMRFFASSRIIWERFDFRMPAHLAFDAAECFFDILELYTYTIFGAS